MKGARLLLGAILFGLLVFPWAATSGEEGTRLLITGRVVDSQGLPLESASMRIRVQDSQGVFIDEGTKEAKSQADGSFLLALPSQIVPRTMEGQAELTLEMSKASYATLSRTLSLEGIARMGEQLHLPLGKLILEHRMGAAFFIATFAFLLIFGSISFQVLHETIAALMGAVAILGISYLLQTV